MKTYNKIMIYFWLATAIILFVTITYLGFTEGFDKWAYYYVFALLTVVMYFMRKWMMKREEKHLQFLENQKENQK